MPSSLTDRCHSLRSLNPPPAVLPSLPIPNTEVKHICADNTWRPPVAVPDKIIGLALILDFIDRCHSLTSFYLPLAARGSLPQEDR